MSSARPPMLRTKRSSTCWPELWWACCWWATPWSCAADSDIWGHMAIGVDTLRLGHLLRVDPYSLHDPGG